MGELCPYSINNGEIYLNGELLGEGVPDFTCDCYDVAYEYIKENITYRLTDPMEFTCTIHWDRVMFWKLTGLWDYVIKYCPNRRLAHLVKYGKNRRVRVKNFYRATAATFLYANNALTNIERN